MWIWLNQSEDSLKDNGYDAFGMIGNLFKQQDTIWPDRDVFQSNYVKMEKQVLRFNRSKHSSGKWY